MKYLSEGEIIENLIAYIYILQEELIVLEKYVQTLEKEEQ